MSPANALVWCGTCKKLLNEDASVCEACGPKAPLLVQGMANEHICLSCNTQFQRRDPRDRSDRVCTKCRAYNTGERYDLINAKERLLIKKNYNKLKIQSPFNSKLRIPTATSYLETEEEDEDEG